MHAADPFGNTSCRLVQASAPVPAGPVLQTPLIVPIGVVTVQEEPFVPEAQASIANCGGAMARPQTSVEPSRAVKHTPDRVSPSAPVTSQVSFDALPAQASTSSCGGAGGFGTQATDAPSMVPRHVPVMSEPPFVGVMEQPSPAAFPEHASSCPCAGTQSNVPDEVLLEESAVESAVEALVPAVPEAVVLVPPQPVPISSATGSASIVERDRPDRRFI